jgi:hypothetical protein
MSKPIIHAESSAKLYGGIPDDYMDLHNFLDSSKAIVCNSLHRVFTHNSWFISVVIPRVFGEVFARKSDGVLVSSRDIAEQHVSEDYGGFVPSAQDFLDCVECKEWMNNGKGGKPKKDKVESVPYDKKPKKPKKPKEPVKPKLPFPLDEIDQPHKIPWTRRPAPWEINPVTYPGTPYTEPTLID